jgi:hypothetical protein
MLVTGMPPMATVPITKLGADGCVPFYGPDDPSCCPPPLCGNDLCCTYVAFFNILPSGPLWDYWKAAAISYFTSNEDPAECPLVQDPACPSLVLHSIYVVDKLKTMVHGALWPAFRESSAYTAVTTLDYQLEKLRWEDCYREHCRTVLGGDLTPYEVWSECGPVFCEVDFPPELECAIKRNVAIALTRANMGVIKNLCSINWIIEPLGAQLFPVYPPPVPVCVDPPDAFDPPADCQDPWEAPCIDCDEPTPCESVSFELCQKQDWIYGCPSGDVCETQYPLPQIPAYYDRGCDRPAGLPDRIWPAVLAAECIVRSMLPPTCPTNIKRCC